MKSPLRLAGALLLALGASTFSVRANAQHPVLKTKIPFEFMVNNTLMPAGEYTITVQQSGLGALILETAGHTVAVQSSDSHDESESGSRLLFYQYGDQHFLHKIVCPHELHSLNRVVASSKAEKGARQREEPIVVAVR